MWDWIQFESQPHFYNKFESNLSVNSIDLHWVITETRTFCDIEHHHILVKQTVQNWSKLILIFYQINHRRTKASFLRGPLTTLTRWTLGHVTRDRLNPTTTWFVLIESGDWRKRGHHSVKNADSEHLDITRY